jgi:hypothetical protein
LKPDFDDSSYNPAEKTVIAALEKYSMLLSDGGEIALTFADDSTQHGQVGGSRHRLEILRLDQAGSVRGGGTG